MLSSKKKLPPYQKIIGRYGNDLWKPDKRISFTDTASESWFDIKTSQNNGQRKDFPIKFRTPIIEKQLKSIKIELKPNKHEKRILRKWETAYTMMYNKTIQFIKTTYNETGKTNINFKDIRTNHLKSFRDNLIAESDADKIRVHVLDTAIKLACTNYKSALSNIKNRNIKHFRIRYWRHNRRTKTMEIEHGYFTKKLFLTKIKAVYDKKSFDLLDVATKYKHACKLVHDTRDKKYYLYVPTDAESFEYNNSKGKSIALDPGARAFLTGFSEDMITKISTDQSKIRKYHNLIAHYRSLYDTSRISKKKRDKVEMRTHRKIKDLVNDLHWKSIRFLVHNYETVLIGNLGTSGIVSNMTSKLDDMTKNVFHSLRFFVFRQRLEYKCKVNQTGYKLVDESYTTKICSGCGFENNPGRADVIDCGGCKFSWDRDVNGARGIMLKSLC